MIKRCLAVCAAAAALAVTAADAKTLRWASQGDPQTRTRSRRTRA